MILLGLIGIIIIGLPHMKWLLKQVAYKGMFYKLDIMNVDEIEGYGKKQGISYEIAKEIQNDEQEEAIPAVFYEKLEDQLINSIKLGRSGNSVVYKLVGDSSLLFPDEPLLQSTDIDGCLISKELAWQLFGDFNVIGTPIRYEGQDFTIRGLLNKDVPIFVTVNFENEDTAYLRYLIIKADSYRNKERYKEKISRNLGIGFSEQSSVYQRLHSIPDLLPNRISNFSQWVDMFDQIFGNSG